MIIGTCRTYISVLYISSQPRSLVWCTEIFKLGFILKILIRKTNNLGMAVVTMGNSRFAEMRFFLVGYSVGKTHIVIMT